MELRKYTEDEVERYIGELMDGIGTVHDGVCDLPYDPEDPKMLAASENLGWLLDGIRKIHERAGLIEHISPAVASTDLPSRRGDYEVLILTRPADLIAFRVCVCQVFEDDYEDDGSRGW